MLRRVCILILFTLFYSGVYAQCLTEYDKIIPEVHSSLNNYFGASIAQYGDYLAVGDVQHDTLTVNGGSVFLYKREADSWNLIATMVPSDSKDAGQFGQNVVLTENYLFVSASGKTHVYVYAKNGEWKSGTESNVISSPEKAASFGHSIKIRQDENKLLISDPGTHEGIVYVFTKPIDGWERDKHEYIKIEPPSHGISQSQNFGSEIEFQNNLLAVTAPNYKAGPGCVYVYKDNSAGDLNDLQLQARLLTSYPQKYSSKFGSDLEMIHGHIFVRLRSLAHHVIFHFKARSNWEDAIADTVYYPGDSAGYEMLAPMVSHDSTLLVIGLDSDDKVNAYTFKLSPQNNMVQQPTQFLHNKPGRYYLPNSQYVNQDGTLSIGFKEDPGSNSDIGTFWIVPKEEHLWKFNERYIKNQPYITASEDHFGVELHKADDFLLVGSTNDKRITGGSGSVRFYKKTANGWQEFHEILADSGEYNFGQSIQYQDDTLYISNSSSINIFSKGADFSEWKLEEKIYPPDSLFTVMSDFGAHIVKNGSVLAAMANTQSSTHSWLHTLFIFEKESSGWHYKQHLVLTSASVSQNILSSPLAIYDETILVGEIGASIIEKNSSGIWQRTTTFKSKNWRYTDRFGHSVILTNDLAFVGAPYDNERGEVNNGNVFVFKRNGPSWQDNFEHTIIQPIEVKTDQQLGVSMALFDNKLAVGALMSRYIQYIGGPVPEEGSENGSVYIFEATDSSWNQYNELGQVKSDVGGNFYGASLLLDKDGLMVGAAYDHHENGKRSGAVYHAPILNFPEITVDYDSLAFCNTNTTFKLEAALEGGTWKGPGVDEDLGTFNPQQAGVGKHTLFYQGLSCFYRKHIYVDVSPNLYTFYKQDKNLRLCESNSASLAVNPVDSAHYQWFYLEEGKVISQNLEQDTSQIQIDQPGKYWVEVCNSSCSQILDTISVKIISAPVIKLPEQQIDCNSIPKLSIENFNPDYTYRLYRQNNYGDFLQFQEIDQAEYVIKSSGTYQLVSSFGSCQWTSETFTITEEIEDFNITTEAANTESCYQDQWFKATQGEQYSYSWKYYPEEGNQATTIGSTYKILADKTGYYEVTIYYAQCSWTSDKQYFIRKEIDGLSVSPETNEIEACAQELWLEAPLQEGFTYTWNYYNEAGAIPIAVGDENKLLLGETGYYELNIRYGQCDWESEKKYVKIHEPTVIEEMGNVITPNGDGVNDTFGIPLNNTIKYELSIFNRLGKLVFQTQDPNDRWGGESCAAGVYVWNLSYQNICDQSPTHKKGMVSIVRRKN